MEILTREGRSWFPSGVYFSLSTGCLSFFSAVLLRKNMGSLCPLHQSLPIWQKQWKCYNQSQWVWVRGTKNDAWLLRGRSREEKVAALGWEMWSAQKLECSQREWTEKFSGWRFPKASVMSSAMQHNQDVSDGGKEDSRALSNQCLVCSKTSGRRMKYDDWAKLSWQGKISANSFIAEKAGDMRVCTGEAYTTDTVSSDFLCTHIWSLGHELCALGITGMSRAGRELSRSHWSATCIELYIVPLNKNCFFLKGKSVSATGWGYGVQAGGGRTHCEAWCWVQHSHWLQPGAGGCHCWEPGLSAWEKGAAIVAQSKQEREERETKHHRTSVQFCTVHCKNLKNTSNLFHI